MPVTPDLVLILLFLWAARHSIRESLLWLFFTGIVLDVLALDPLGANGLALVVLVILSHPLRIRPWQFNATSVMLLVFMGSAMHGVVLALLRGTSPDIIHIGLQAGFNVVLVPLIFFALRVFGR